jgi:ribosome-binding factor A
VLSLTIKGQRELQKLAEDLRRAKGTLRQELTRAFKEAGKDTLSRVKHNAETMSIRGRRKGGRPFREHRAGNNIRRRIARITELEVSSSAADPRVKFIVRTDRLADIKAESLPWHFDSGKVFRHPIMGNRSAWAGQTGQPWFYNEIKKDRDIFVAECDKAIDRTIQQIEKG